MSVSDIDIYLTANVGLGSLNLDFLNARSWLIAVVVR